MKTEIIKTATLTLLLTGIVTLTYGQVSQGGTPYSFDRAIKTKQEKSIISKENLVKSTMSKVSQTQIDSIKQKNENITTVSGSSIFQSSGSFSSSPVCVGVIPSDVGSGTYVATVSFSNDCHEISNTYQFFVMSCKNSSDGNSDSEEEKFARSIISDTTRLDFNFAVFPNPNDGNFSIKIPNGITMPYSLEIINSAGKIMYSIEHINANRVNVNQTGLTSGAYFIRIKSANRIASQKFIIQ